MSTMALGEGPGGLVAAWETDGKVYFSIQPKDSAKFSDPQAVPGRARGRKHPALACNSKGEILLAWTEGTGWEQGGSLAWQVFDKTGKPTDQKEEVKDGIPVWGLPTVVATDKGFIIIH